MPDSVFMMLLLLPEIGTSPRSSSCECLMTIVSQVLAVLPRSLLHPQPERHRALLLELWPTPREIQRMEKVTEDRPIRRREIATLNARAPLKSLGAILFPLTIHRQPFPLHVRICP